MRLCSSSTESFNFIDFPVGTRREGMTSAIRLCAPHVPCPPGCGGSSVQRFCEEICFCCKFAEVNIKHYFCKFALFDSISSVDHIEPCSPLQEIKKKRSSKNRFHGLRFLVWSSELVARRDGETSWHSSPRQFSKTLLPETSSDSSSCSSSSSILS